MRTLIQRSLVLFALLLLLSSTPAQAADCEFRLGFKTLRNLIGHEIVGDCLENEHYNEISDSNQQTTGGLMAWRKADNWTAFTDGYRTWINGPNGLVVRLNTTRFEWEADYSEIVLGIKSGPTGSTIDDPIPSNGVLITPYGKVLISVGLTMPDAWPYVLNSNQFNDAPGSRFEHFIVGVSVSNISDIALTLDGYHFKLVGDRRVVYNQYDNDCGVVDEELDVELYPSGTSGGLICFEVSKDDGGFILIFQQHGLYDAIPRFISVPVGCPNQRPTSLGVTICRHDLDSNFDLGPQIRALGLG